MLPSKIEWKIATRYLGAQRKNIFVSVISLFSMLGVAIGTFAFVLVLSGMNGFEEQVTKQMMGKDAHGDVVKPSYEPIYTSNKILEIIEAQPEVTAAAPYIISKVGVSSKSTNDGIVIYGLEPEKSKEILGIAENVKFGQYNLDSLTDFKGKKSPGILVGKVLARRLGVIIGDRLILQTFQNPDLMGTPLMVSVIVSGIFETGMFEYDGNISYVSLKTAQQLLGMGTGVTGVHYKVTDPWLAGEVAERVQDEVGGTYYSTDWRERNQTLLKWMSLEKVLFGGIIFLIVLIAAFNIISSLIMLVDDKLKEIGILRAMGMSSASILRIFVTAGALIGIVGSVLGTSVGLAVAWSQQVYGWVELPADVYLFATLPMKIHVTDIAIVFVASNVICILATIAPALKASLMHPVKAIHHE